MTLAEYLPYSKAKQYEHRRAKRIREVTLALEKIRLQLPPGKSHLRVLEFGSGDGFQVPYLRTLGDVVASDIYYSNTMRATPGREFVLSSATDAPFAAGSFDVIYSNHVIEHIEDLVSALRELRRVGTTDCVYAFAVPTNYWMLLSLPAQYWNRIRQRLNNATLVSDSTAGDYDAPPPDARTGHVGLARLADKLLPTGHGVSEGFVEALLNFRISHWQRVLRENGFSVRATYPLLLYGPSEWPLIPTREAHSMRCSSVLFVLSKLG